MLKAIIFLVTLMAVTLSAPQPSLAVTIVTWNLGQLADSDGEGCRPRSKTDYELLQKYAESLQADVVAVQEVENTKALARVFDPKQWSLEISRRPERVPAQACNGTKGAHAITRRTGFAIKNGIRYTRNPDLKALDLGGKNHHRYGVDITLEEGFPLRLLAIHLKSDCKTDSDTKPSGDCRILFQQRDALKTWIDGIFIDPSIIGDRRGESTRHVLPIVILGKFNLRLRKSGDFWRGLHRSDRPEASLKMTVAPDKGTQGKEAKPRNLVDFIVPNVRAHTLFDASAAERLECGGKFKYSTHGHCAIFLKLSKKDFKNAEKQKKKITRGLKWYRRSAEFPLISQYIYRQAMLRVDELRKEAAGADDWVISVDADETILDNSLGQLESEFVGVGYRPALWERWEKRGAAKAIPGAIRFMNYVLSSGGKLAVITNRNADYNNVTFANLVRLGLNDDRRKVCVLGRVNKLDKEENNPQEWRKYGYKNDKDRRRRLLELGQAAECWSGDSNGSLKAAWNRPHSFVLWIGDNVKDLPLVTQEGARRVGTPNLGFGKDYFLLPNPLYGSWRDNAP